MNCPTDGTELLMSDRQGIEIDFCPTCRGVWLDRGELDKIIERSALIMDGAPPEDRSRPAAPPDRRADRHADDVSYWPRRDHDDDDARRYGSEQTHGTRKKTSRRSFLADIFEID